MEKSFLESKSNHFKSQVYWVLLWDNPKFLTSRFYKVGTNQNKMIKEANNLKSNGMKEVVVSWFDRREFMKVGRDIFPKEPESVLFGRDRTYKRILL